MNRTLFGDCRATMRDLIAQGVRAQMCVTSPPYWGLRSYLPEGHPDKHLEIGSEPTLHEWVRTMVEVFRLVRELLADDGVLWLNLGDSYAGGRRGGNIGGSSTLKGSQSSRAACQRAMTDSARRDNYPIPRSDVAVSGLKPKDLMGQPWRVAFALQDDGWWLRQDCIWHKPNPMPESVTDRCTKAHEYLFLLSKSERYYWDFEAMQEPVNGGAHPRSPGNVSEHKHAQLWHEGDPRHRTKVGLLGYAQRQCDRHKAGREKGAVNPKAAVAGSGDDGAYGDGKSERMGRGAGWNVKQNESFARATDELVSTRNRRSVWTVPSTPYKAAHFATFPPALIGPCILAGSRPGDVVLDPFIGSGTTGQVAQRLGRRWIGCELHGGYEAMQQDKTAQGALELA
jgi:DNA modification methylase